MRHVAAHSIQTAAAAVGADAAVGVDTGSAGILGAAGAGVRGDVGRRSFAGHHEPEPYFDSGHMSPSGQGEREDGPISNGRGKAWMQRLELISCAARVWSNQTRMGSAFGVLGCGRRPLDRSRRRRWNPAHSLLHHKLVGPVVRCSCGRRVPSLHCRSAGSADTASSLLRRCSVALCLRVSATRPGSRTRCPAVVMSPCKRARPELGMLGYRYVVDR